MDYIKPFGVTGSGRPAYQNGNPAAGIQGSIPDVAVWEYPMREIIAVIEAAGITPSNADLTQLLEAIRALTTTNTPSVGSLWHIGSASAGSSSAYTTNLSPSVPNGATGFFFSMPVSVANTQSAGKTTVDWGQGPKTIVDDKTGLNIAAGAMSGGSGYVAVFYFDGTNALLLNPIAPSLAAQGVLFNLKAYSTSTRVAMSGSSSNNYSVTPWTPGPYVKKSATSLILALLVAPSAAGNNSSSMMSLTVGGSTQAVPTADNYTGGSPIDVGAGASCLNALFVGLPAGSLKIGVAYYNPGNTVWNETFCPTSADKSYFSTTSATLIIAEIEVTP